MMVRESMNLLRIRKRKIELYVQIIYQLELFQSNFF